jgi:hypothetical protein
MEWFEDWWTVSPERAGIGMNICGVDDDVLL